MPRVEITHTVFPFALQGSVAGFSESSGKEGTVYDIKSGISPLKCIVAVHFSEQMEREVI